MAVLVLVVVVTMVNLAVIAGVSGSGDDAQVATLRVETLRAFYAAEAGATIVGKSEISRASRPSSGSTLNLGVATVAFVSVPTGAGSAVVEGRSGFARRRIQMVTE